MRNKLIWLIAIGLFFIFVKSTFLSHSSDCNQRAKLVKEELSLLQSCATDEDCTGIIPNCPFGCFMAIRKDKRDEAFTILGRYTEACLMICPDRPKDIRPAVCVNNRCSEFHLWWRPIFLHLNDPDTFQSQPANYLP